MMELAGALSETQTISISTDQFPQQRDGIALIDAATSFGILIFFSSPYGSMRSKVKYILMQNAACR